MIDFTHIYTDKYKYTDKYEKEPSAFKLSQKSYNDLYDFAMKGVIDDEEIDKTKDRPIDSKATIFGVRIVISNRMKHGNWKFE